MTTVRSGHCYRCKRGALLYPVVKKDGTPLGTVVLICYECRELIRRLQQRKGS